MTAKADTLEAGSDAAHAIMTTDTISKEIAIETEIGGKTVTLGGMCKGSGMIHPNMCTMLGFVTTDVNISKEMLQKCVSADVVDSFNMISVDGDTSTNDTLLVLANGMAGNEEITAEGEDYDNFCKALHEITTFLAKNGRRRRRGNGAVRDQSDPCSQQGRCQNPGKIRDLFFPDQGSYLRT